MSSMMWSGDPSELGASAAVVQGEMLELLMCSSVAGRERVEVQSIARLCEVCQAEMWVGAALWSGQDGAASPKPSSCS